MSENRRITLFLEDESEMTHQEGLDVFQKCLCLTYFQSIFPLGNNLGHPHWQLCIFKEPKLFFAFESFIEQSVEPCLNVD